MKFSRPLREVENAIAIPIPQTSVFGSERTTHKEEARRVRTDWNVLIESLFAKQDALGARVRDALRIEYALELHSRFEKLHTDIAGDIVRVMSAARAGHVAANTDDAAELLKVGESWAHQGVPFDEMLRAWHIGVEAIVAHVREVGQRLGADDGDLLEFVQSAYAWSDTAVVAAAKGHQSAEIELAVTEEERRETFIRSLLFGNNPISDFRVGAEAYGLDPTCEYVAVRARLGDGQKRKLEQALGFHRSGQNGAGLCAVVDGALAGVLIDPPPANFSGLVGVGPPRPLRYVAESYRLATRALMTMQACGLQGAHDFSSLGLRTAVAMDADVGEVLRKRYLDPLSEADSARELIGTVRAFLACDMHVERTATRLFVHQNTVRYRLARFEELTGASLRSTHVVVELWWALALSEMSM
jgi:hypothetical protein